MFNRKSRQSLSNHLLICRAASRTLQKEGAASRTLQTEGMIDHLKNEMGLNSYGKKFGNMYIIAPENAGSGTSFDKTIFNKVFQYGSDETNSSIPSYKKDGVAPQRPVKGLKFNGPTDYSRVSFPAPTDPKYGKFCNFLDAHSVGNYGWIFEILNSTKPGYVSK